MAKRSKMNTSKMVNLLLALVGCILTIVALFVEFLAYKGSTGLLDSSFKLSKLADIDSFSSSNVFTYVTMGLSVGCIALLIISELVKSKIGLIRGIVGLLTIISAVVLMILLIKFCSDNSAKFGSLKGGYIWSIGAYLAVIGGAMAGVGALLSFKN